MTFLGNPGSSRPKTHYLPTDSATKTFVDFKYKDLVDFTRVAFYYCAARLRPAGRRSLLRARLGVAHALWTCGDPSYTQLLLEDQELQPRPPAAYQRLCALLAVPRILDRARTSLPRAHR